MIYRQVIPPAPAYLGLNLFLKGSQMPSKSGFAPKREKPKLETKPKIERKSSQLTVRMGHNGEMEKIPILSPRSLLIDFSDLNNNNAKSSFIKSNTENVLKNEKVMPTRMHSYLALTRHPTKQNDVKDQLSGRKSNAIKILDSSRRRSCGPKLMSLAPVPALPPSMDDGKAEKIIEIVENDRKNIKCVGNKCGPELEIAGANKATESNKSSPRKPAPDVLSSSIGFRTKLKPVTALSKSAKTIPLSKELSSAAAASNDYRKYLSRSSLQLNRIPSKHPIHGHNSHFHAVGLSLRAWRSKYSRMKENSATSPSSNSTLKGKSKSMVNK